MYDDEKLIKAFRAWQRDCLLKKNGHLLYCGSAEADFEEYCFENDLLKSGCGRVAFGRLMGYLMDEGLCDRVKRGGRVYYAGLALKSGLKAAPRVNRVRDENGELVELPALTSWRGQWVPPGRGR